MKVQETAQLKKNEELGHNGLLGQVSKQKEDKEFELFEVESAFRKKV